MIHRERLANGLDLVVLPSTAAPLASIHLWMEAGSIDERTGEEGAAHLLEHMLFKGTPRRGPGQAAAAIEGVGGDLNAYTSYEQTVVHATVEASAWGEALDVLVDMVRHATLDPAEFDREKQVVLEEIRGYDDDPESVAEDALLARLYPDHAYGRPILGTPATVGGLTRDALHAFWQRTWHPDRAILAVAGDVEPGAVQAAVEALLGDWPRGTEPRHLPEPAGGHPGVHHLADGFETTTVQLGWRTPPAGHPDAPALNVLTAALADGAAAVLPLRLQIRDAVASDVGASLSMRTRAGDLTVGFLPREARTAASVRAALDAVDEVARQGLTGAQVARARDTCLADFLFGAETVDGIAHDAAWFTARLGRPEARESYRAALAAVTADDVRRVARTWLRPDHCAVVALDKHLSTSRLAQATRAMRHPPRPAPPGHEPLRVVTDHGATLWVLPDDTPVAAIRVAGLGGGLAVDARRAGLHEAWSRVVTAGAGDRDAEAFAEAIDAVAGTLYGVVGRNSIGLGATFPADHVVQGIDLVGAALVEPRFDPSEVHRVCDEMAEEVRTLHDRPGQVGVQTLWRALWPRHPWRLPSTGTEASLDGIGPGTLRHWHRRLLTADNLVVAVTGGVDPATVIDTFRPWLDALPPGPYDLRPRRLEVPPGAGPRRRSAGREQAWVISGWRGAAITDPDRLPLLVAASLLGAQGGRLFLSLREQRGLAYSVWARSVTGWDGGVFTAGLATDPARAGEARRALREALRDLVGDAPPTAEEVQRTRRMLIGQAAMGLQRAAGRASDLALCERFGLPWGLERFRSAMADVTRDRVVEAVGRVLSADPVEVLVEPET